MFRRNRLNTFIRNRSVKAFGWLVTLLPVCVLIGSGLAKVLTALHILSSPVMDQVMTRIGWSPKMLLPLGFIEIDIVGLYMVPWTAFIGAVLGTGYLGGAIATNVRVGEPFLPQLFLGICLWLGFVIRNPDALRVVLGQKSVTGLKTLTETNGGNADAV